MIDLRIERMRLLLPLALEWAEEQEEEILEKGAGLSDPQMEDARLIGVRHPEKVRILEVPCIPLPEDPQLAAAAAEIGLITERTEGMTLGYGIFIRARCRHRRRVIVHELVHAAQYERLGGLLPFLEQYLSECVTRGYPNGPLEREAMLVEREICSC